MLSKISKDAIHFLDPSAGKGDLAKAILGFGRNARDFGHYGSNRSRHRVDVIESDPDLIHILRANEDLNFVGMDWLTYSGVSYYDAIVMNPPFSNGAAHLIHAWEFLHAGEIVCLLNQETIDNPYTDERQRLAKIIAQHGSVEALGQCFRDSERPTDVHVALVYLKKTADDDRIDLWHTAGAESLSTTTSVRLKLSRLSATGSATWSTTTARRSPRCSKRSGIFARRPCSWTPSEPACAVIVSTRTWE